MPVIDVNRTKTWRYAVTWTHATTGECKLVVVTLSEQERLDAIRHKEIRGDDGPGGPVGPIVRGYAMTRAAVGLDEQWTKIIPEIDCITFSAVH